MRGLTQRHKTSLPKSSHHAFPIPFPQHCEQRKIIRVSQTDFSWCRRCSCQSWWFRSDLIFAPNRDHSFMSENHGERHRPFSDSCNFHHLEDSNGQQWADLSLHDCRALLCSFHCTQQHGRKSACKAINAPFKAHYQMLLQTEWKSTRSNGSEHDHALNCERDAQREQKTNWSPRWVKQKAFDKSDRNIATF